MTKKSTSKNDRKEWYAAGFVLGAEARDALERVAKAAGVTMTTWLSERYEDDLRKALKVPAGSPVTRAVAQQAAAEASPPEPPKKSRARKAK